MAEITFDKFWGWLSPTSLYANQWQCAYIEWIDTTQNISKIKNTSPWRKEFLTDWNDMLVHFTATSFITSKAWYAWEGGQIYHSGSSDNTPEKQLSNTRQINDSTTTNWYIYLIQDWTANDTVEISRMNEDNAALWSVSWFNEKFWTSNTDWGNFSNDDIYVNSFWEATLIVTKGSQIYYLWITTWALSELASFNIWRTVVGVTTSTDFVKFYTKDWRILMYNKARTLVSETITWELFHKVITANNRDYVVWEDGLYYVNWNTLVDVLKDGAKWLYSIQNNRNIFTWRTDIYLDVEFDNDTKLLRIGTDNAGFPEAMTILPTLDSLGNEVSKVYWVGGRFTLSAWMNVATTGKGIYELSWASTNASGVLITEKHNWWSQVKTKEIQEIKISWKFQNNSTIQSIINDDQYSSLVTLDNGWDKSVIIRTPDLNAIYLDLALKVNLKGNDQLYWITLVYNDEQK